jgi:16S rRNA (uracil1498-N3)-methyltransferase
VLDRADQRRQGQPVERLAAIATEAAEQCERLQRARDRRAEPLAALLAAWPAGPAAGRRWRAETGRCRRPLPAASRPVCACWSVRREVSRRWSLTFCGPASLCSHMLPLGPRVLRAETAAIVGLALLQAPAGPAKNWSQPRRRA